MATTSHTASRLADARGPAAETRGRGEERAGEHDLDRPDCHALYGARERAGEELPE